MNIILLSFVTGGFMGVLLIMIVEDFFDKLGEDVRDITKSIIALSYTVLLTVIIYYTAGFYFEFNYSLGLHWILLSSFMGHFTILMLFYWEKPKKKSD